MKTKLKKAVAVLSICLLAGLTFIPVTASAHHGHHSSTRYYSVCRIKNCHKSGVHKHHGKTYCGGHSSKCYSRHRHC